MRVSKLLYTPKPAKFSRTPTHECPCGSDWWSVAVSFDDYEISSYLLDMTCLACGRPGVAPTLVDRSDSTANLD